jgi:hypothetical protein
LVWAASAHTLTGHCEPPTASAFTLSATAVASEASIWVWTSVAICGCHLVSAGAAVCSPDTMVSNGVMARCSPPDA